MFFCLNHIVVNGGVKSKRKICYYNVVNVASGGTEKKSIFIKVYSVVRVAEYGI